MSDPSLERVLAFNRELSALSATGLPMDIGIGRANETIDGRLEKINTVLATRIGRGQTIEQAIAEEPALPPRYRTALWTWLSCDDPTIALDGIATPAEAQQQFRRSLGRTMLYPLIVLSVAYFAFLYLCSVTVPKIQAIYDVRSQAPSDSLSLLIGSRNLMPICPVNRTAGG